MISAFMPNNMLLYLRGHFANSSTSAVELAQKTKSSQHIAFADKLLKIKMAAPDAHLESVTRYKGHFNYRASRDELVIRQDKYQSLSQQLERVKEIKNFLQPVPTVSAPASTSPRTLWRPLNRRLDLGYGSAPRTRIVKANIYLITEGEGRDDNQIPTEELARFARGLHKMIDNGKCIEEIANATIAYSINRSIPTA